MEVFFQDICFVITLGSMLYIYLVAGKTQSSIYLPVILYGQVSSDIDFSMWYYEICLMWNISPLLVDHQYACCKKKWIVRNGSFTENIYRKTSNISRILVGNKIVDNSDVEAPTTSSFST